MKKQFLLMAALLLAVCVQAQVLKTISRSEAPKFKSMIAKKAVTPNENQMWWGYYFGDKGWMPVGTDAAQTYDCAIGVPANDEFVGASTIKAICFHLTKASNVSMAKVWISTKGLLLDVDKADYVQDVAVSALQDGANEIVLNTPFVVNNKAIYVGYSFTINEPELCIVQGGDPVENGLFVRGSVSIPLWGSLKTFGNLGLHLLLEADYFPTDRATPSNFGPAEAIIGESIDMPVDITNTGRSTITSISYVISTNGVTSEEKTIDVKEIPFTATATVAIPVEADATAGIANKTLTITKVNGNANNSINNTTTGKLTSVQKYQTWPRTVLIEQFTTEQSALCANAANGLTSFMTTYPKLAEQVAVVSHHAGDGTDWLTIDASQQYLWFYNSNYTGYAPAFMYDRYYDRFASDAITPVEVDQETAEDYKSRVESRLVMPSNVGIELKAIYSVDNNSINVSANCERSWNFSNTPSRITVYLIEDNINARAQAGASGVFTHRNVLRAVSEVWGKELSWTDNKASYKCSFKLNPKWMKSNLKVIAFVSAYDYSDPTNCAVENTAVSTIDLIGDKGDVNRDGKIDIVDVTMTISYILGQNPKGFDKDAADINNSGKVDIVDVTTIIDIILNVGK